MPLDFLFSSWFFYLTWKLQHVIVVANAWDANPNMPYDKYQAFGAYMLFFASTVYLSRHYFRQVVRRALGLSSDIDDSDEPLRYRWAFVGIGVGLALLIAFTTALGLSPWLGIVFFAIYLALALAITRMRAELGTPVHDLHFTGPNWMFTDFAGPRALGTPEPGRPEHAVLVQPRLPRPPDAVPVGGVQDGRADRRAARDAPLVLGLDPGGRVRHGLHVLGHAAQLLHLRRPGQGRRDVRLGGLGQPGGLPEGPQARRTPMSPSPSPSASCSPRSCRRCGCSSPGGRSTRWPTPSAARGR